MPINSFTITEKAGVTTNNYPIQIARPFIRGEIRHFPKVVMAGTPLETQADVKQRWEDGSVKHAVLTFYIPTLNSNSTSTYTFQNSVSSVSTTPLNTAGMLAAGFNFDAIMELTSSGSDQTISASARTMLNNNSYSYWLSGSNCTSIVLADHLTSAYDIGFSNHDNFKSFRPIFYATFFPLVNKVRVRFVGEIASVSKLQDMKYSVVLKTGNSSPTQVFTNPQFTHYANARWTKEFWIGGDPTAISINHNMSYLVDTLFFPNYDTTLSFHTDYINTMHNEWTAATKTLGGAGQWARHMGTAGGRYEIGPVVTWNLMWMYHGDMYTTSGGTNVNLKNIAFGNGELATFWPNHYREDVITKKMDWAGTINGIGRPVSSRARPTIMLYSQSFHTYAYTNAEDKVINVGTVDYEENQWNPDDQHYPDPFSPLYALSGDRFWIDEMYFWAAWAVLSVNGAAISLNYGRGPTGREGILGHTGVRGPAWTIRMIGTTSFFAPDSDYEKTLYKEYVEESIAAWEGMRNMTESEYYGNACWNWGNTVQIDYWSPHGIPPRHIRYWKRDCMTVCIQGDADYGLIDSYASNVSAAREAESMFEVHYMEYVLGKLREFGFKTDRLLWWISRLKIFQVNELPNPLIFASGRFPTRVFSEFANSASPIVYITTPQQYFNCYQTSWKTKANINNELGYADHGYPYLALAGMSMISDMPGGKKAWEYISSQVLTSSHIIKSLKWAIKPRRIEKAETINVGTGPTIKF